jgi:hypothetical protein
MALDALDRDIGLELADVAVDGYIVQALATASRRAGAWWIGKMGYRTFGVGDERNVLLGVVTARTKCHD